MERDAHLSAAPATPAASSGTSENPNGDLLKPWSALPEHLHIEQADTWYKGDHYLPYPRDRQITLGDILSQSAERPRFISRETKVLAMGSCFAEHFVAFLARHAYNRWQLPPEPHSPVQEDLLVAIPSGFENIFTITQQLRWAFEEFTPQSNLWFTKDKRTYEATEDRREKVNRGFREADVFILTLGLSEVWFDQVENEPMWRTIPLRYYEPGRHVCRAVTVAETLQSLIELNGIVERFLPAKRIVLTLSPIPLTGTFRNQSVIAANQVSKAVLRAALDQFLSDPQIAGSGRYFYFPSYEIVFHLTDHPFLPDNRHVRPEIAEYVLNVFSSLYTDLPQRDVQLPEESARLRTLEDEVRHLHKELAEKEKILQQLAVAARERLELIQRLTQAQPTP